MNTWTPSAVASELRDWRGPAWRVVEAQHVASTMKLVDDVAEQDLLEGLLEASKPAQPGGRRPLHYLLATPFRYPCQRGGSRFRAATDPGVFYGAGEVRTACLELGYWRWRFLRDAPALAALEPIPHTAFRTALKGRCVDLAAPPLDRDAALWTAPDDYGATQAFARTAREAGAELVRYASVRDPGEGWCVAALTPAAFARRSPDPNTQTWWLRVTRDRATWRRGRDTHVLDPSRWHG